jgi:hypothetical protein
MLSSSRLRAELLSCARFSLCIDHAPSSSFLMRAPSRSSSLLALQLTQVASICVLAVLAGRASLQFPACDRKRSKWKNEVDREESEARVVRVFVWRGIEAMGFGEETSRN